MLLVAGLAFAVLPSQAELFGAVLAELDADGDGQVTASEYAAHDHSAGAFEAMDADRSGAVTVAEFSDWALVTQPRPMDRPPQVAAVLANGGVAPPPGIAPAPAPAPAPLPAASPPPDSPWPRRALVLGGMLALAAPAAWWILRAPTPKRRRAR